ncbi:hypothetical protein [Herbaspirillum sp. SJZ107]|uniref:hypothetical protein n=1 Tax=Herbaspirillum sp. SJZ107 TaxID=2572881 RepID=UPI001150C88C|nr:hypothetical protein [Herbaspirillum sp. SJZ107]TQK11882.1 hypothetical protein FBX97_1831 [Herbaspirillum sp. SJZ107]
MKKIALGALLLSVFGFANPAIAAGNAVATTMQVSFVIQEACTVRVADGSHAAPAVSCVHQAPVQVSAAAGAAQAEPSQTVASADSWQIYF